jgi:transposase
VREWLPEDHLAWFVIDAVGVIDLSAFYVAYREDGHGRAAYEPSMLVALLLYCWSRGVRSSRRIQRACVEDVACRVIAAHQQPDHATIARLIERHETALAGLFGEVLWLCADAGLATVGVIAIDGTMVSANASRDRTMSYEHLGPMHSAARAELAAAGVSDAPDVVVADAGYWHQEQMNKITASGVPVLIPPDSTRRKDPRPGWTGGAYDFMRSVLSTERGKALYKQRAQLIEPIFGNTKHNREFIRFARRGRSAVRTEWRLIATTHNLLKLHQHFTAPA